MPRIHTETTSKATALRERFCEKLRDEFATGLDKTGPQWESAEDEQEAAVRAAGATAYYEDEEC